MNYYLVGLRHEKDTVYLSYYMRSRIQVGEILRTSSARVTVFRYYFRTRMGVISHVTVFNGKVGYHGMSKRVLTKSQPISVDNVVTYLVKAIDLKETEGK
jgi:hypothetical protein